MTRFDAVNYISHGIAKVAGLDESRTVEGADTEGESETVNKKGTEALDAYCVNLNKKAEDGKLDPLIGRSDEVDRTIQILCRRTKNNPLYVGDPGVGKTAIAEACVVSSMPTCPRCRRKSRSFTRRGRAARERAIAVI